MSSGKKKKRRKPEIMEPIIIKRGKKHSRNVSGSLSIQILCYFSEFIMLSVIVSFLNFLMHCTFFLPSKELVTITLYFVFVILCYFLKEGSKNYKQWVQKTCICLCSGVVIFGKKKKKNHFIKTMNNTVENHHQTIKSTK